MVPLCFESVSVCQTFLQFSHTCFYGAVHLSKLIVGHLVTEVPAFREIRKFSKLNSVYIFPSTYTTPKCSLFYRFSTKITYWFFVFSVHVTYLACLDSSNDVWYRVQISKLFIKNCLKLVCYFLSVRFGYPLFPNILIFVSHIYNYLVVQNHSWWYFSQYYASSYNFCLKKKRL
jgi:hypothetical protein